MKAQKGMVGSRSDTSGLTSDGKEDKLLSGARRASSGSEYGSRQSDKEPGADHELRTSTGRSSMNMVYADGVGHRLDAPYSPTSTVLGPRNKSL